MGRHSHLSPSTIAIDGTTLSIDGPPITESGNVISLASSGIAVDGTAFAFPTPASGLDIDGFIIDGQTLIPDGAAITIAETPI